MFTYLLPSGERKANCVNRSNERYQQGCMSGSGLGEKTYKRAFVRV